METQLVDGEFIIERFPGKGGWCYVTLPGVKPDHSNPFGWVRVKGTIDSFELKQYKLMPMGNGRLFLPVRAEIRKFIKKEEGDTVRVTLFTDDSDLQIPQDILASFELAHPRLKEAFDQLSEGQRKGYVDWITSAKTEETKVKRIAELLNRLESDTNL